MDVDDDRVRARGMRSIDVCRQHPLLAGDAIPRGIADELGGDQRVGVQWTCLAVCPALEGASCHVEDVYVGRRP